MGGQKSSLDIGDMHDLHILLPAMRLDMQDQGQQVPSGGPYSIAEHLSLRLFWVMFTEQAEIPE
ncbi:hypothetical protein FIBSPDRAFT_861380 [Athelia psychrophila]|uniref:Uncharacterized protein n=1 Tax=Athelia psychrophila TaxID=1759441 RepID=A0A166J9K3_9AGAM|nr:hypothetical protein FIBSPDRAFT_861380 [Fibularhizoctonia sp. CBS 109695]